MANKIRVLHVGLSSSFGGIESFLLTVCTHMNREIYSFDFVAYDNIAARENAFASIGNVLHITNRRNPFTYMKELSQIYNRGYDIIHIHKNSAIDIMPFICWRHANGAALIAHSHNTSSSVGVLPFLNSLGRKKLLGVSKRKFACSIAAGQWLYGPNNPTDRIIPNGIDLGKYAFDGAARQKMRKKLELENALVIGCVGRFSPVKNQAFVLQIVKKLRDNSIDARGLFLGDGAELESTKALAIQLDISRYAIFTGSVQNVSDYMQAIDVLAMPSYYEGFPIVAIEAQASGLPVLLSEKVTDEACLTDMVRKLSIAPGSEGIWANMICELVDDNNRMKDTNDKLANYDIATTIKIIDEEYRNVLR